MYHITNGEIYSNLLVPNYKTYCRVKRITLSFEIISHICKSRHSLTFSPRTIKSNGKMMEIKYLIDQYNLHVNWDISEMKREGNKDHTS